MKNPGPSEYEPDYSCVQKSRTSNLSLKVPTKGLKKLEWRFEKSALPDMGTYDPHLSTFK